MKEENISPEYGFRIYSVRKAVRTQIEVSMPHHLIGSEE
jgi:hypothetical protein